MTADNPGLRPALDALELRMSERVIAWHRKRFDIKTPQQALQLEKSRFESEFRLAREVIKGNPCDWALVDATLDRIRNCSRKLEALDPECGCENEKRWVTYERQIREHRLTFPWQFDCNAGNTPRLEISSSPSPGHPSTSSQFEEHGDSPSLDEQGDKHSERFTSIPAPRQSARSHPPAATGGDALEVTSLEPELGESGPPQGNSVSALLVNAEILAASSPKTPALGETILVYSPESEQHGSGPRQGSHVTSDSIEIELYPIRTGDSAAVGDTNPSSCVDVSRNYKRKVTDSPAISTSRQDKRMRLDETGPASTAGDSIANADATTAGTQFDCTAPTRRTIEFDDLYENGNGEYKHFIVNDSRSTHQPKYYILRCDEHGMHFGDKPLQGAAKHLSARSHGKGPRDNSRAIEIFGVEVLNCDPEKQKMNNDAFIVALSEEGYRPRNNPSARWRRPLPQPQQQRATNGHTRARGQRDRNEAVLSPVPGEIYLGYWGGSWEVVGIIILPLDCFSDRSFADIGIQGSLATDTLLLDNVPQCYRTHPDTGNIIGWEEGYEDGGARVEQREYPVMYFNGVEDLRKASAAWMPATDIREYDRNSWSSDGALISNYAYLQQFEKRQEEARAAARRDAEVTLRVGSSVAPAESDLSEQSGYQPADHGVETVEMPGDTASFDTGPALSGSYSYSTDAAEARQHLGTASLDHAVPPSSDPLTNSFHLHPSFVSTTFASTVSRPPKARIVGHASMHGDGVPSSKKMGQATGRSRQDGEERHAGNLRDTACAALSQNPAQFDSSRSGSTTFTMHPITPASSAVPNAGTEAVAGVALGSATDTGHTTTQTISLGTPLQENGRTSKSAAATRSLTNEDEKAIPPRDTELGSAARQLGDKATQKEAIDLEQWEQQITTGPVDMARRAPQGISSPFRRSFEHPPAILREPVGSNQYWAMHEGTLAAGQQESGEGIEAPNGAEQSGRVPQATMMPLDYPWLNSFDA